MTKPLLLIQMAGRSGVGKSTLAKLVAPKIGAVIIDYDTLKTAALEAGCSWYLAAAVGYGASRAITNFHSLRLYSHPAQYGLIRLNID